MRGGNLHSGFYNLEVQQLNQSFQEQATQGGGSCGTQEEQKRRAFGAIHLSATLALAFTNHYLLTF